MNTDKSKSRNDKLSPKPANPAKTVVVAAAAPPPPPQPVKVPPMFRRNDWLALLVAFIGVWIVYLWTLAPEQTLEDSGELCTASYYAGIPHPPGYPFWSIYSWFWTFILPIGNVAWRVEVGESFAAAMGCGLLALMVSRGSSMLIEGIEELKSISKQWETAICMVSGTVAGLLLGLGVFMWKESDVINRISLFGVPWLLAVVLLVMRWGYAPQQRRYLYLAMLFYGWLATIHQSLLVSVPGIEILIALVLPRLGRDLFVWNTIGYGVILALKFTGTIPALNAMTYIETIIFHVVGLGSLAAWNGIYLKAFVDMKQLKTYWLQWFWWPLWIVLSIFVLLFLVLLMFKPADAGPNSPSAHFLQTSDFIMTFTAGAYGVVLSLFSIVNIWKGIETRQFGRELLTGLLMGLVWILGVFVYFYEPISCMTNPPMQWGYPRTVEGFFHALSRGQYGSDEGTNVFQNPSQFLFQLFYLVDGLSESFNWAYLFVGLIPFAFLLKMHKRERNWIIGLAAIYFWISVVLVVMLNVNADRMTIELNKVFFTASHAIFAMLIGYGITILAAYIATHYEKIRAWCFVGAVFALFLALYCLADAIGKLYFGPAGQLKVSWLPNPEWGGWGFLAFGPTGQFGISDIPHCVFQAFAKDQFGLPVFANLILIALPIIFLGALFTYRKHGPVTILLALFAITPFASGLANWNKCEQRNHWFGYWYGHDMFSPPFLDNGKLSYDNAHRAELLKDPVQGRLTYPEMARSTILFGGTDPGRFCPTYSIFCDSFIPRYCKPKQDQEFDRRDVYIITQNALADGTYLDYLRAQYFRSQQKDPPFFSELSKYIFSLGIHSWRIAVGDNYDKNRNLTQEELARENLTPDDVQRDAQREAEHDTQVANRGLYGLINNTLLYLLDKPFLAWGRHVEAYRRAEGVYPPNEIYIPSPDDSQVCFNNYYGDLEQRLQHDQEHPNEPRQIQPGEDVSVDPRTGRMSVSGEISVMMINGEFCRMIFNKNPTNEFYIEESFPLPWMYPYETPFGIIMKINRNPVKELTRDDFDRDHKFWTDYSQRLCGNWITYDTTISNICDFIQRTYIQNNYADFTGARTFLRDEDAQKGFSKLRDSQAGMYAWRCGPTCPPEYREPTPELQEALRKETDFAFKQAFAFCPYSQEVISRYIPFLMQYGRIGDALLVAKTCLKLDPYNGQIGGLVKNLEQYDQVESMETEVRQNPEDYKNIFALAGYYMQSQQTNRASELMQFAVARPNVPADVLRGAATFFVQTGNFSVLENILKKLTAADPGGPDGWYDLSRLEVLLGKKDESLKYLKTSLDLSDERLKTNPAAMNIRDAARSEASFNSIRNSPDFQKLVQ